MADYQKLAQEQQKRDKLIGPGAPVFIPKTSVSIQAYRDEELFSLHDLRIYLRSLRKPVKFAVQKKYDGVDLQVHRTADGKFYCFTENLRDVTDYLKVVTSALNRHLPDTDYILIGELEVWTDGEHWNRADISGTLNSEPDDSIPYVFTVFDIIWFDGKDIHNKVYKDRFTLLESFDFPQSVVDNPSKGINLCPTVVSDDIDKILRAVRTFFRAKGSEGAILKEWEGFRFRLNGYTSDMIKIKKFVEGHFKVLGVRKIEGTRNAYQYEIGVLLTSRELPYVQDKYVVELDGRKYLRVGKTFNTSVRAKVGDIITVRFTTLTVFHDKDGRIHIGVYSPVVYELREHYEEPDTLFTLIEIGREAGLLVNKSLTTFVTKSLQAFLSYPDESKHLRFVMQNHFRGETVHTDLRMETSPGGNLIGYTLMTQKPKVIDEPVVTLKDAERWSHAGLKLFKFDPLTGRWERSDADRYVSIQCALKEVMPPSWLDYQGVTDTGSVGATANFPGVFYIAAQGRVEYGFREPHFHEYFFYNPKWEEPYQRIVFRVFHFDKAIHEDESREEFVWLMIKAIDLTPYVLSRRAATHKRYPPPGVSALPHFVRDQIPKELRYWTYSQKEYTEVLDQLRQELFKGKLKLNFQYQPTRDVSKSTRTCEFIYKRRWWRGPIVVRVGPSRELWDLYIHEGDQYYRVTLLSDLRTSLETVGYAPVQVSHDEYVFEGELPPESPLNPNKEIQVHVDIITQGQCVISGSMNERAAITFESGDGLSGVSFDIELEDETTELVLFRRR